MSIFYNGYFVAYFDEVYSWNLVHKPYCDITVVATRVTKEKQSGHLTLRCAHVTML